MTTWTPKTEQAETWTATLRQTRVFSPLAFSLDEFNGVDVFAIGSPAGIWTEAGQNDEVWTPS